MKRMKRSSWEELGDEGPLLDTKDGGPLQPKLLEGDATPKPVFEEPL